MDSNSSKVLNEVQTFASQITGIGTAFPKTILSNEDLVEQFILNHTTEIPEGFNAEWIFERTGIRKRHYSELANLEKSLFWTCASLAAQKALILAKKDISEVDGILFATCTPDHPIPSAASLVHKKLKAQKTWAIDLNAACSGFQHALTIADQMIRTGFAKNILVIGADVLSTATNFNDPKTAFLFGDGAGAVVLSRASDENIVMDHMMVADGQEWDYFFTLAGGSLLPSHSSLENHDYKMQMKGTEIFKTSVSTMGEISKQLLARHSIALDKIDWIVPHQANLRIIEALCRRLKFPLSKVAQNIEIRGNTSAATVPTALFEAFQSGQIKKGQTLLITTFGAGTTSGASLLKWAIDKV